MDLIATTSCSNNNWGELDGDLLNLIISKLFGKDRLSFSLVCRRWNEVAKTCTPPSPCLISYHRSTHTWKYNKHNTTFFDTTFPDELQGAEVQCFKHGWLLMSRDYKDKDKDKDEYEDEYEDEDEDETTALFFFNPSNNHMVELPPLSGELWTTLCFFHPPTSGRCVVVGISTDRTRGMVDVCTLRRGGLDAWEIDTYQIFNHNEELSLSFDLSLGPPVLHDGMIYIMSVRGDIAIIGIVGNKCVRAAHFNCLFDESEYLDPPPKALYLVKVEGEEEEEEDELFGVFVFGLNREVDVCRLSPEMKWESVGEEGIGDKVLYVSYKSCFGYKARTKEMENTVCFPMFRGDVPVVYSLSDDKYRSIDGEYSEGNAHGLRSLEFATWVMPTPAWEVHTNFVW